MVGLAEHRLEQAPIAQGPAGEQHQRIHAIRHAVLHACTCDPKNPAAIAARVAVVHVVAAAAAWHAAVASAAAAAAAAAAVD
jgi:hypothetical protein